MRARQAPSPYGRSSAVWRVFEHVPGELSDFRTPEATAVADRHLRRAFSEPPPPPPPTHTHICPTFGTSHLHPAPSFPPTCATSLPQPSVPSVLHTSYVASTPYLPYPSSEHPLTSLSPPSTLLYMRTPLQVSLIALLPDFCIAAFVMSHWAHAARACTSESTCMSACPAAWRDEEFTFIGCKSAPGHGHAASRRALFGDLGCESLTTLAGLAHDVSDLPRTP